MATVTYDEATRFYPGSDTPAVDRLNIDIGDGEFLVLVGPSGCGKSTSLRMLAGLEDVDEGAIRIGCGSRGGTSGSPGDRTVGVASLVDPLAFLVEMEHPVVVEVSVAA